MAVTYNELADYIKNEMTEEQRNMPVCVTGTPEEDFLMKIRKIEVYDPDEYEDFDLDEDQPMLITAHD